MHSDQPAPFFPNSTQLTELANCTGDTEKMQALSWMLLPHFCPSLEPPATNKESAHRMTGGGGFLKQASRTSVRHDREDQWSALWATNSLFNLSSSDLICLMYRGLENEISGPSTNADESMKAMTPCA